MLPSKKAAIATLLTLIILTLAPAAIRSVNASTETIEPFSAGAVYRFVFLSVLEGLYTDNVPNEIVDRIIPPSEEGQLPVLQEHFVYGCPLCSPAYYAFLTYRQRPPVPFLKYPAPVFDLEPTSLDQGFVVDLSSPDHKIRMAALQDLINTWIARSLETSTLSEAEKASLVEGIRKGREQGMGLLKRSEGDGPKMDACAVCEGAFGASSLFSGLDVLKE